MFSLTNILITVSFPLILSWKHLSFRFARYRSLLNWKLLKDRRRHWRLDSFEKCLNICFHLVIVVSIDYSYSFCFIMDFFKIFFLFISSLFSGIYTSCLWYLILPFIFAENLFRLMTEFVASFVLCSFSGMSLPRLWICLPFHLWQNAFLHFFSDFILPVSLPCLSFLCTVFHIE